MYSTDGGTTWATTTSPFDDLGVVLQVIWDGSQFVAVGTLFVYDAGPPSAYVDSPCIATSPDGQVWTRRTEASVSGTYIHSIAYNGTRHVAYGSASTGFSPYLEYSDDGCVTWTQCTYTASGQVPVGGPSLAVDGSNKFWMLYRSGTYAATQSSANGITFGGDQAIEVNGYVPCSLAYGGGSYLAAVYSSTIRMLTSSTGVPLWNDYGDVAFNDFGDTTFAAFGNAHWFVGSKETLAYSTDLLAWTNVTLSDFAGGAVASILYTGGTYFLGGAADSFIQSFFPCVLVKTTNLVAFSVVSVPADAPGIRSMASNGSGRLVAAGNPNLNYAPPGIPTNQACGFG